MNLFYVISLIVSLMLCPISESNATPFNFDSNGRLAQVDAAFEAANKGSTVIGLRGKESVVIITHIPFRRGGSSRSMGRRMQPRRVFQLCDSISYVASGIAADSQYLANKMFEKTSDHLYAYGTDPSIHRLAKEAADICHMRTLANNRPLGIKAIFAGTDKTNSPSLLEIDPVGNIHNCKISCLGLLSEKIVEAFHNVGKDDDNSIDIMDTPSLVKCGLKCLNQALERGGDGRLDLDPSEVAVICHDCTNCPDTFSSSLIYVDRGTLGDAIDRDDFSGLTLPR